MGNADTKPGTPAAVKLCLVRRLEGLSMNERYMFYVPDCMTEEQVEADFRALPGQPFELSEFLITFAKGNAK